MPLTEKTYRNLNEYKERLLDQFIYRSLKLQDAIGQRLLPELFLSIEDEVRPFIDILNRVETSEVTISRKEWLFLIKLRYEFLHECSTNTGENVESLNRIFNKIHYMYKTFITIKEYTISKFDFIKAKSELLTTPAFPDK
jgi:hypothetical protein